MFFKLFKKIQKSQLVSVLEYPDFYLFETFYKTETGLWKRTDLISIENKNLELLEIGKLILFHLKQSKTVKESKIDFKIMNENYKKITRLSSIKKQMDKSKNVQIFQKNGEITFTPTVNGGTTGDKKGYSEIREKEIITSNLDSKKLATFLLDSFQNCE